jgi:starvation-inducible outer membrane lipoprotein
MFSALRPLAPLLALLLCACSSTGPSALDQSSDDDGPTVYGKISVSVDAINYD